MKRTGTVAAALAFGMTMTCVGSAYAGTMIAAAERTRIAECSGTLAGGADLLHGEARARFHRISAGYWTSIAQSADASDLASTRGAAETVARELVEQRRYAQLEKRLGACLDFAAKRTT